MGNKPSNRSSNPEREVYEAARDGTVDLNVVLKQISKSKRISAIETKTKDGDGQVTTPLIIAARKGHTESVKVLLKYKADIEARGTVKFDDEIVEGCTPLWAAAASGHLHIVKLLIDQNANVNGGTLVNSTPLRVAAYDGRLDIVKCLVESGADVNASTDSKSTPLMVACYNGHMNVATYLMERVANIDLQNNNGDTALHYAAEGGNVEIANKLLDFGALHLQNNKRLTPLLAACNKCKVKMVEYFIRRPECTKELRIDALELLGASIANEPDVYDVEEAFHYMRRAMEERFLDPTQPLLKNIMEPLEVYQNRKESQTVEELVLLEGDEHAIRMEGLIMRERILGTDNTELCDPIRDRGADFADSGNFDLSIGLWRHAMEIAQRFSQPITDYLECFAGLFGEMVEKNCLLRPTCIEGVYEKLILQYERLTEKLNSSKLQKGYEANSLKVELERMLYCALYLLMIYTKVQDKESAGIIQSTRRLLFLSPRTHDGNTLLHLATWHKTPIKEEDVRSVCKLPCVETIKLILQAGCDVNAVNTKGDSALHLAVTFKPNPENSQILKDMLEVLSDNGADVQLVNRKGKTAVGNAATDEARRILSGKRQKDVTCHVCTTPPESPITSPQEHDQELTQQCNTICSVRNDIKVAILALQWRFPFSAFSHLSGELAIQLSRHPQVTVSLLVPQQSFSEEDKKDAFSYGITIIEAQARPGCPDPIDWLYVPPKDFVTDVLVALDDSFGKIAQVLKENRQCKRIQVVYSLSKESGAITPTKSKHQSNAGLCEGADLVVAIGSNIADELRALLRYCKKEVFLLTPGIMNDLSNVSHTTDDGRNFRILVLSCSSSDDSVDFYEDRLDIAAKAVAELRDKTFHLIFHGVAEGKQKEFLQMCCQCGVLEQQLAIRSFPRTEEDLRRLFCEVDLSILLSAREGSDLTALGALSARLPVVVTGDSGFAEALKEVPFGDSSVVCSEDSENPEAWAAAIKRVRKTNRNIRLKQAASLRSRFDDTHSWADGCKDLVERMLKICQN